MPDRPPAPPPALPNPLRPLRPRAKPRQTESAEQQALIKWARLWAPRHPELGFLFAIPNGGARSKATAGRLKAEGVLAGVPDLFLPVSRPREAQWLTDGRQVAGLFIELKTATGRLSDAQKDFRYFAGQQGYLVAVARSWHEAAAVIVAYLDLPNEVRP